MTEKSFLYCHLTGKKAGKKVKVEAEKIQKFWPNISTSNITELNELIFTRLKLDFENTGIPPKNPNRNLKPGLD